jgi:hypothetical protein
MLVARLRGYYSVVMAPTRLRMRYFRLAGQPPPALH